MARVLSKAFRLRITRTIQQAAVAGVPQPRMGKIRDGRRGKGSLCDIIGRSEGPRRTGVSRIASPVPPS
ncbi:hypothetical protein [Paracoccus sp. 08]|uniref:hypothetical protein n=1 Tax=Paracoccus sp. 08 TaxID=2606624 RepID=UPI0035317F79